MPHHCEKWLFDDRLASAEEVRLRVQGVMCRHDIERRRGAIRLGAPTPVIEAGTRTSPPARPRPCRQIGAARLTPRDERPGATGADAPRCRNHCASRAL